jgi:hypothetical protein
VWLTKSSLLPSSRWKAPTASPRSTKGCGPKLTWGRDTSNQWRRPPKAPQVLFLRLASLDLPKSSTLASSGGISQGALWRPSIALFPRILANRPVTFVPRAMPRYLGKKLFRYRHLSSRLFSQFSLSVLANTCDFTAHGERRRLLEVLRRVLVCLPRS